MNESSQACCEHYQSEGWMNTLSCKAQLRISCLTACLSSCLSTCLPDYLPTYRAPFVQILGARMGGEVKYSYICAPQNLAAYLPANCPASFYYSLWQDVSLSTRLLKISQLPLWVCAFLHAPLTLNICFYWISQSLLVIFYLFPNMFRPVS